jgi:hypothetical protein
MAAIVKTADVEIGITKYLPVSITKTKETVIVTTDAQFAAKNSRDTRYVDRTEIL